MGTTPILDANSVVAAGALRFYWFLQRLECRQKEGKTQRPTRLGHRSHGASKPFVFTALEQLLASAIGSISALKPSNKQVHDPTSHFEVKNRENL